MVRQQQNVNPEIKKGYQSSLEAKLERAHSLVLSVTILNQSYVPLGTTNFQVLLPTVIARSMQCNSNSDLMFMQSQRKQNTNVENFTKTLELELTKQAYDGCAILKMGPEITCPGNKVRYRHMAMARNHYSCSINSVSPT